MGEIDAAMNGTYARALRPVAFAVLLAIVALRPALAVVMHGSTWSATYVAAYQPTFGNKGVPYSGTMKLTFKHGIVSGTYVSDSVRPDPLYGKTIPVSGGVQHGQINLNFGSFAGFSFRGTIADDGEISGTATIKGKFYHFLAKVKSSP
jgi:hypothetical protein